jgi:hypothetical protein
MFSLLSNYEPNTVILLVMEEDGGCLTLREGHKLKASESKVLRKYLILKGINQMNTLGYYKKGLTWLPAIVMTVT